MLRAALLGHAPAPVDPGALLGSWHPNPLIVLGLAGGTVLYVRGRSGDSTWRDRCAALALVALVVTLVSPLDAAAAALASAHMVQHLGLTLVAAPLLVVAAPLGPAWRATPAPVRRVVSPAVPPLRAAAAALSRPVPAWLLHTGALWLWHSAVLYDAALRNPLVHGVEHISFLATGVLFWNAVLGRRSPTPAGPGLLLVFTMTLQGVLLAALLTFASDPWYAYEATEAWGLDPLTDQQLAGLVMWVPGGLLYTAIGLALVARWIAEGDRPAEIGATSSARP